MRNLALITIEGVLSVGEDLRTSFSNNWTRPLYDSLRTQYRVVLLTGSEEEVARQWCEQEFVKEYAFIDPHVAIMDYPSWRADRIRHYLSESWDVSMVVDTHDLVIEAARQNGVMSMKLTPPSLRRGWKATEEEVRPWDQVAGTVRTRPRE